MGEDEEEEDIYNELEPEEDPTKMDWEEHHSDELQMDDFQPRKNYDLLDAQKDIQKLREEVRKKENLGMKPSDERDEVEEKVSKMMEVLELAQGRSREQPDEGHEFHEAYTMLISASLVSAGFLYSGMFMSLYILGILYVVYDNAKFLPGEKKSYFAKLTSNHPRFYILGGIVSALLFLGAGFEFPMPEGMISTIVGAAIGV